MDGGPLDDRGGVGDPRRWPYALLAAVLGAAGGAAVALLVRRRARADAPELHELRAVVDRQAQEPTR